MDNCHLGDKTTRQLDVFQDLVPDRDSDVFSRNELSQPGCQPSRNWDTGETYFSRNTIVNMKNKNKTNRQIENKNDFLPI